MGASDNQWARWGAEDPYFAVLTEDRFHAQGVEANRRAFFETGEEFVRRVVGEVDGLSANPVARGRALDFGCGVGRLTLPLARSFREAVGVDISPGMLQEAAKNAREFGASNVTFVPSDDGLSSVTGQFDLVNSYITLQHVRTARGERLMKQLLGRVAPGGGAMLHLCVRRFGGPARRAAYYAKLHLPLGRQVVNLLRGRAWDTPVD